MLNWDTVAIPFAAGIKPTSHGRTLEQTKLLTAQNCFFLQDEGPQKRYGHTVRDIKTSATPPGTSVAPPGTPAVRNTFSTNNALLSANWLHGWGWPLATGNVTPGSFATATEPRLGHTFGQFQRDNEVVFWDGFRLLSYPNSDVGLFGSIAGQAVMPAMRVSPIAKSLNEQKYPDAADNGVVKTVVWIHGTSVYYAVFDSVTGATLVNETVLSGLSAPSFVRVLTMGAWTHILVENTGELFLRSFQQDTPLTLVSRSIGETTVRPFDVNKISENHFVVVRILSNQIKCSVLTHEGANYSIFDVTQGGETAANVAVTSGWNQVSNEAVVAFLWAETGAAPKVFCQAHKFGFGVVTATSGKYLITTQSQQGRLTIADCYLNDNNNWPVFVAYIEDYAGGISQVRSYNLVPSAMTSSLITTRHRIILSSHAFRVGQRNYVWTATTTALQSTWFLCDMQLLPVGKQAFGLANVITSTSIHTLPGVNWQTYYGTETIAERKDRVVYTGALGYKQRADTNTTSAVPNGVFSEPSINFYTLDFLPRLRTAQAGRSTYIAGAQLWEYDGAAITEAGFHLAPEGVSPALSGAGNLSQPKVYRYRVDLCYKNAQDEEVRSWSIITSSVTTSAGQQKVILTIPHVPMTRRDNAYFLVFRTEGDGTAYYLCSSRNPADSGLPENKFLKNDRASATYTFVDNLSDANLITREYHPANATNYVQPLGAPACELVASGRDRLWLAGGELAPGEVAPSRLFFPGETPSFSPAINVQIDRNSEAITAIGFVGEIATFFRKTSTYTLDSDGMDNTLNGTWGYPRLALADVGAVSQEGLALAGEGLYFQSPAGIRVLTPGGGLRPPGAGLIGGLGTDVDTLTGVGIYAAAVVVPKYSQIRWYSLDSTKPTMVVDYTKNVWTTWTNVSCVGAGYWPAGDTVILSKGYGITWKEVEGRYLDGDLTYEMIVKTAWLHGAAMGDFQRVSHWLLTGDADTGLSFRYRIYYDERPFHGEENSVTFNGDTNSSTWGDTTWGSGSWGDSANSDGQSGLYFRDNTFRIRKRLNRQKCSVVSFEFSDQGSNGNFSPVVLGLRLGRKAGLDKF